MKKANLLLIPLLPLLVLSACDGNSNSEPQPRKDIPAYVTDFIESASKSYTLRAQENETIYRSDDNARLFTNTYSYANLIDNNELSSSAVSKIFSYGSEVSTINYVRDQSGFAANEALNFKNEVITKQIRDSSGSRVNFDQVYVNPFSLISSRDLMLDDDETVRLSDEKKQIFSYYLLETSYQVKDVIFNFENEEFSSINITSINFDTTYIDLYTYDYIQVYLNYDVTVLLSDVGNSHYEHLTPISSKDAEREAILTAALTELGTNYTMIMNEHYQGDAANHDYDSYWYFDGSSAVYHQQTAGDTRRFYDLYYKKDATRDPNYLYYFDFNETTSTWEYSVPAYAQSYNNDPMTYEEVAPKINQAAAAMFDYNETTNTYSITNSLALAYIGNEFLPGTYAISYFTNGQGNKCEIKLNGENKVDTITVGYYREDDEGNDVSRDFEMRFINIGNTVIPDWVEA